MLRDEFFDKLKERFPVKNLGGTKHNMYNNMYNMYTGRAFKRDWNNGILEMKQMAFAGNTVEQYKISTAVTPNIPGSPGIDLGTRNDVEPGGYQEFPQDHAFLVGNLM